ncbi:unnamed protein product [Medioppia subpectinata]|uniref:C2H2-type domain-containing protein n=1 Tax=Medioppia subpectinata TaxID=1979941 RepID=A0A7R9KR61_9ACAR|nr:unnamed protein product [Medioppia subpectinata]CAG2107197.1 unnamed protein product [Medioppia subpectinata]
MCKHTRIDDCNAVFNRLYRLNRHLRRHSGERPFVCPISGCFRAFSCKSYLTKHLKRPHNTDNADKAEELVQSSDAKVKKCYKQYVCKDCDKVFKTKFQFKMHCFQHSGVKPFECDKCDQRFVTKAKLKSHLKTHDGYACAREGCDYKTFKWSELRKHIAVFHRVYLKCDSCDKLFKNSFNLHLHQKNIHLSENHKIVCTYANCGKSYSNESNLKTHIRTTHEKQLFECTQEGCDKTFLHKKSLAKHLETHSKPLIIKAKNADKIYRKKRSEASKLTSIALNESQTKQILDFDFEFRNEILKQK